MRPIGAFLVVVAACSGRPAQVRSTQNAAASPSKTAVLADTIIDSTWSLLHTISTQLLHFDTGVVHARAQVSKHPGTSLADSLLLRLRDTYLSLAESLTDEISTDPTGEALAIGANPASEPLQNLLARHGFRLNFTEGNAFVDESSGFFLGVGGASITSAMREFLSIRSTEEATRFSEDAALQLPWDSVAERVARWDAFLAKYPDFSWRPAAADLRATYLATYLTGMDNTHTQTDSGPLQPEVVASYRWYLRRHPHDASATIVRDYSAMFEARAIPSDSTIRAFLRTHHLETMLGVQPFTN